MPWKMKIIMTDVRAHRYQAVGTFTGGGASTSYSCAGQLDPERSQEENCDLIVASLRHAREKALAKLAEEQGDRQVLEALETAVAEDLNAKEVS